MALVEDPTVFLQDFGVPVTAGGVQGFGILDLPGQLTPDGMAITTEYALRARSDQFGWLLYGDEVTVAGIVYQVREAMPVDDGVFVHVALQRLDPGVTAVGRNPRDAMVLDDLADVTISNAMQGEVLQYDGQQWRDASGAHQTLVDASTAGVIYTGTAPTGTAQSANGWTITRSTFNTAGIRTARGQATGVSWTGRASHSYS